MGQRVHPNIFRLGINKNWKSKYFEKKPSEVSKYTFKDIEIKEYIKKFLEDRGLSLHNCNTYYSESSIYIFVSYYLTLESVYLTNKNNKLNNIKFKSKPKATNFKKTKISNSFKYQKFNQKKNFLNSKLKTVNKIQILKNIGQEKHLIKQQRTKTLRHYKSYLTKKSYKTIKHKDNNNFSNQILKSLNLFVDKEKNVFITFQQLNQTVKQNLTKKTVQTLKKNFAQIRKYNRNEFFKNGVNIMYMCTTQKLDSSELLAQYIANQLQKLKRHNFFLRFLKTTLTLLNNNKNISKLKGIKIRVKGRFNGAPRARHKTIKIGNVPVLSLKTSVDYAEETSYTSNGTFGVKVWICK